MTYNIYGNWSNWKSKSHLKYPKRFTGISASQLFTLKECKIHTHSNSLAMRFPLLWQVENEKNGNVSRRLESLWTDTTIPHKRNHDKFKTIQCQFQYDVTKMNASGAPTPISLPFRPALNSASSCASPPDLCARVYSTRQTCRVTCEIIWLGHNPISI